MMEAAIRGAPAGRILCLVNGHSRAVCTDRVDVREDVDRYDVPWGQVHLIPRAGRASLDAEVRGDNCRSLGDVDRGTQRHSFNLGLRAST
jgi:hypothetical protein